MGLGKDILTDVAAGVITGLIIGDEKFVFPIDMVAIPAYQASMINGNTAFQVYIKAGETLQPTGGNVADMSENMDIDALPQTQPVKKPKKRSAWNRYTAKAKNKIYTKAGKLDFKKMSKEYAKTQGKKQVKKAVKKYTKRK